MTGGSTQRVGGAISRRRLLAGAAASLFTTPPAGSAQAAVTVPSRGVNIPDWLDKEDGRAPAQAVLEKLRQCGFETIRLPVDGMLSTAPNHIRQAIERLVSMGFAVLVDMHPSARLHATLRDDPAAGGVQVAKAWMWLREVIADLPPTQVYPELLNEPPMRQAAWLSLRDRLAGIVRDICPDHTIVWGPALDQGIWHLGSCPPLADHRQIAAVHFYAPTTFTHQCQSWGNSPLAQIRDLPYPARRSMRLIRDKLAMLREAGDRQAADLVEEQMTEDWTGARVQVAFEEASRWSAATGCPLILNEFGVLGFCADTSSRLAWLRAVRRAAEAHGIGWALWELDQGFGFIQSRSKAAGFDAGVLDVLFGSGD